MATTYGAKTITNAATLIIAANAVRKGLILHNAGSNIIYIGPDASITTANAIVMYPAMTRDDKGLLDTWRGAVYGIVATGTEEMRYWEWEL